MAKKKTDESAQPRDAYELQVREDPKQVAKALHNQVGRKSSEPGRNRNIVQVLADALTKRRSA